MDDDTRFIAATFVVLIVLMSGLSSLALFKVQEDQKDWDDSYYPYNDPYRYNPEYPETNEQTSEEIAETPYVVLEPDWQNLDKTVVEVPIEDGDPQSADYGLDINDNDIFEFIIIEANINVIFEDEYGVVARLCAQMDENACNHWASSHKYISETFGELRLTKAVHRIAALFPGPRISLLEENGPYEAWICIYRMSHYNPCAPVYSSGREAYHITNAYSSEDFESPRYVYQAFEVVGDYGLDNDTDGYYDHLVITINTTVLETGEYHFTSYLRQECIVFPLTVRPVKYLSAGFNSIHLFYSGEELFMMGLEGNLEIRVYTHYAGGNNFNPTPSNYYDYSYDISYTEDIYITKVYNHSDWQPAQPPVNFTGTHSDAGYDSDGDGLYDYLRIGFDVDVLIEDDYRITLVLYEAPSEAVSCKDRRFLKSEMETRHLGVGIHNIQMDVKPGNIINYNIDGPYEVQIQILPVSESSDPILIFNTGYYSSQDFDR
jgi:hypothetical protein